MPRSCAKSTRRKQNFGSVIKFDGNLYMQVLIGCFRTSRLSWERHICWVGTLAAQGDLDLILCDW